MWFTVALNPSCIPESDDLFGRKPKCLYLSPQGSRGPPLTALAQRQKVHFISGHIPYKISFRFVYHKHKVNLIKRQQARKSAFDKEWNQCETENNLPGKNN